MIINRISRSRWPLFMRVFKRLRPGRFFSRFKLTTISPFPRTVDDNFFFFFELCALRAQRRRTMTIDTITVHQINNNVYLINSPEFSHQWTHSESSCQRQITRRYITVWEHISHSVLRTTVYFSCWAHAVQKFQSHAPRREWVRTKKRKK